eukprot:NODE_14_length_51535_cov_1.125049.p4 type:complete len:737 gc:universal NODE_14_length_51535_cov_1.125049:45082-42872(-)
MSPIDSTSNGRSKYPTHILKSRIENFVSNNSLYSGFTLPSLLIENTTDVEIAVSVLEPHKVIKFQEAVKLDFKPTGNGGFLGKSWATSWGKVKVSVPKDWITKETSIYLHVDGGCEGMIYSENGAPLQCVSENRQYFKLNDLIQSTGSNYLLFYIEFACNRMFGNGIAGDISPSDDNRTYYISALDIKQVNNTINELQNDLRFLKMCYNDLTEGEIKNRALNTAHEIVTIFNAEDKSTWATAQSLMKKFLKGQDNLEYQHEVVAVGHCHIDTAWLWGYQQTVQKCMRSWKTQVNFMKEDPEFKFVCSQTIQMEWVKKEYPEVWDEILEFVKKGQFIPIGGSCVEMDGNMPSGEAFCRQMLYGQLFFESEFGFRSKIFWLPDTFGYSGALPQILKSAGMSYFFTQKLSWNNINSFPHHSFRWRGIDSSEVIAHFCPSSTYNSDGQINHVLASIKDNKDLRYTNKSVLLFGDGDGGGGPTRQHLENLARARKCPSIPSVTYKDPIVVYDHLNSVKNDLSVYKGELYFELHRGTFTSQARNKKWNRKLEFKLQMVEQLATIAHVNNFKVYPSEKLRELWKNVLLNQFHDVLPGSSIELVYKDSRKIYEETDLELDNLISDLEDVLLIKDQHHSIYNPHCWTVDQLIELPDKKERVVVESISANSALVVGQYKSANDKIKVQCANITSVETSLYSLKFNSQGEIVSFFDKEANREVIESGKVGNEFRIYEDIPIFWGNIF